MANLYYKNYRNFFLSLNLSYQKKQKFFIYPLENQNLFVFLKKLQENSLISGYSARNSSELQVYLRYDRQTLPAISNVFLFQKCKYISLKKLKAFTNDYPFSVSFLNTKFGVLDIKECKQKNCGGELIVTIN